MHQKRFSRQGLHLVYFEILQEGSWSLSKLHFQTGFFHFDGFIYIGFHDGFPLNYFSNIGEADLARRLHVLRLLNENALGII
jgi:hypothetical protein